MHFWGFVAFKVPSNAATLSFHSKHVIAEPAYPRNPCPPSLSALYPPVFAAFEIRLWIPYFEIRDQNCLTLSLEFSVRNPEMPPPPGCANSSYLASDIKSNLVYLPPFSVFFFCRGWRETIYRHGRMGEIVRAWWSTQMHTGLLSPVNSDICCTEGFRVAASPASVLHAFHSGSITSFAIVILMTRRGRCQNKH